MTNLKTLKKDFLKELSALYGKDESSTLFSWLAEEFLGLKTYDFLTKSELNFESEQLENYFRAVSRLKRGEPIQYILGYTEFFGLKLKVNPNVLIPRPETEELVQWILEDYKDSAQPISIIDLGTGSGCIPITLAKNMPHANLKALDVSKKALELATINSEKNNVVIECIEQDLLKLNQLPHVDVVVSNPPYVRSSEKSKMKENVLNHEPHLALFVESEDPLLFYRKIADLVASAKEQPKVYLEVSQYLAQDTQQLFQDYGFKHVELRKDFRGNQRMLKVY